MENFAADMCRCHVTSLKVVTLHVYAFAICLNTMHLDISCASDPRAQTPEMSTMGPYTMRYKRSVHRVAGGSVSGSCCVNICQNKLLNLSWRVSEERGDWRASPSISIRDCGGKPDKKPSSSANGMDSGWIIATRKLTASL